MRRYRIKVLDRGGCARVVLKRPLAGVSNYIVIADVNLTVGDAEERLADARARAVALAHQVNGLERDRL